MIKFALKIYRICSKKLRSKPSPINNAFSQSAKSGHQSISQDSTTQKTPRPAKGTVEEMIQKDFTLNEYMNKIYKTTGLSVSSSLGLAYLISNSALVGNTPFLLWGGFGLGIGGILAFYMIPPIKHGKVWENPLSRKLAFSSIIASSGILLAPWVSILNIILNPTIIPTVAALSLLVMGELSLYVLIQSLSQFYILTSV